MVRETICRSGRPADSYIKALKPEQVRQYGEAGSPHRYEEDHLIPLELGGAPSDSKNLWPKPGASPNAKDKVETAGNREVCSGRMTLGEAQQGMARNWVELGRQPGSGAVKKFAAGTGVRGLRPRIVSPMCNATGRDLIPGHARESQGISLLR